MWQALSTAARGAIEQGRNEHGKVLWLLADACSMMLSPSSPNEPFKPFAVFHGSTPGNVLATDNLVFVGTGSGIYAVDTTTRRHVWHYPKPGRMALSPQGVLYLVLNGTAEGWGGVVAFNLR